MEAGRFGEGKKNLPKKYGRRKDAAASRWSAVTFFGGTTKKSKSFLEAKD
jgi:hypothetical protein